MKNNIFVLSSTNAAKRAATEQILQKLYGDAYTLQCVDVTSGVSETPHSDDEGIQGALGRITAAKAEIARADAYIGLEGIVTRNSYGVFLCGWAVVQDKQGNLHMGCSAKVQLPPDLTDDLSSFKKLSELTAEKYPDQADKLQQIGTNGVITNGMYTRIDEFVDALSCAFGTIR